MADPWTLVASWTTPSSLFVLLNVVIGFIAFTSAFASRKNDHPPGHYDQIHPQGLVRQPSLISRVTSFNFTGISCNSGQSYRSSYDLDGAAPPPENPQAAYAPAPSFLSRMTSFNSLYLQRSAEPETNLPATADSAEIARGPSLLARMTSFNRFSLNKSEESEINRPHSEPATPSLLSRMTSFNFSLHKSTDPEPEVEAVPAESGEQRVSRSATEPKKKKKKAVGDKLKKSSSEKIEGKEKETASYDEVDAKAANFIDQFKQQLRLQRLDSLLRYRNSAAAN